jgi:hypothetical protein
LVEFIANRLRAPADEIVLFSLQQIIAMNDLETNQHVDVPYKNAMVNVGFSIEGLSIGTIVLGSKGVGT